MNQLLSKRVPETKLEIRFLFLLQEHRVASNTLRCSFRMILRQSKFLHVGGLSLFFLFWKTSCRGLTPLRIRSLTDARSTGGAVITSSTLWIKPAFDEECEEDDDDREKEKQTLRPTMTESEVQGPAVQPEKPKIVVLGASGRIGR